MTGPQSAAAEPVDRRALRLIAAGKGTEAVGELVTALACGDAGIEAARLLARLLGRYRLDPSREVDAAIHCACAFADLDLQPFVRPAIDGLLSQAQWRDLLAPSVQAGRAPVERVLGTGRLAPFDDPLLYAILERGICTDVSFERCLVALRAVLLLTDAAVLPAGWSAVAAALARQASNNEYAWPMAPDEVAALAVAAGRLATAPAAADLVRVAMYEPLSAQANVADLRARSWDADAQALLDFACPGPEAAVPVAPISARHAASAQVQAQYEANPYPRWLALNPPVAGERRAQLLTRCPPADQARFAGPLEVLIAGCGTGRQAIVAALGYGPTARLLAIDLSHASLVYAARMARRYGVERIEFRQADLLDLDDLGHRFDVIEAVGVLHHLSDPLAGWRALARHLKPGGMMSVGVYSERGRQDVVAARSVIAELGLPPTAEGIRRLRGLVLDAPEAAGDWRTTVRRFTDFFSLSGCRDLLFNVQEHRFTPLAVGDAFETLGLELCSVEAPSAALAAYRARFPDDPPARDLRRWDAFEADNPRTFSGMIGVWCRRPATE